MALDRQKPYGKISASALRKAGEATRRNATKRVDGGQSKGGLNLSTGDIVTDIDEAFFFAELTSSSEPYSFKEIWRPSGSWEDRNTGITGENNLYLFEGSGSSGDKILARIMPGNPEEYIGMKFTPGSKIVKICKRMDVCTGTYMTGLYIIWENDDGTLECEDVEVAEDDECCPLWYCVDGVATLVPFADAPPTGTEVSGPYRSEAKALEVCPEPPIGILCAGCDTEFELPETIVCNFSSKTGWAVVLPNSVDLPYRGAFGGSEYWSTESTLPPATFTSLTGSAPICNAAGGDLGYRVVLTATCSGGQLFLAVSIQISSTATYVPRFSSAGTDWTVNVSFPYTVNRSGIACGGTLNLPQTIGHWQVRVTPSSPPSGCVANTVEGECDVILS